MNMREPGIFQARSLTGSVLRRVSLRDLMASNTKYAVINLVNEAGSTGVSISRPARTWLAVMSTSK